MVRPSASAVNPPAIRALLEKGYSPANIARIYGGNLLRLLRAVEAAAR